MTLPPQIPDPRRPDMSPKAIDSRLKHLSQLYRLGMSLRDVKWHGPVNVCGLMDQPVQEQTPL